MHPYDGSGASVPNARAPIGAERSTCTGQRIHPCGRTGGSVPTSARTFQREGTTPPARRCTRQHVPVQATRGKPPSITRGRSGNDLRSRDTQKKIACRFDELRRQTPEIDLRGSLRSRDHRLLLVRDANAGTHQATRLGPSTAGAALGKEERNIMATNKKT